ncbi:MAG: glycosyltransferase family 4 protein [Planctomycetota bacterium]
MRIAHLSPGTGDFYCGTCLRDRTLVRALRGRGHEVEIVPLYLPAYGEDGTPSDDGPIHLGAINLYLAQKLSACRYLPRAVTGRLDSPALLRWVARRFPATDPALLGEMTVAMLEGEEGRLAPAIEALAASLAAGPPFNVVLLSNALLAGVARRIAERTGAAVACTLQGENAFLDALPEPHRGLAWRTLAARARQVALFLAVSRHHAARMADRLGLPEARVAVVPNGIDVEDFSARAAGEAPSPPALGFLARLCAEKGLPLLVDAFLLLRERGRVPDLRLRAAGVLRAEDRVIVAALRRRLAAAGLAAATEFLPDVDPAAKRAFLASLSVLSVPASAEESFGLYLLEAMAAGVPVVQPRHAAFPEILAATGGGILCDPGDPRALAEAIEALLLDPPRARELGERGGRAVRERFTAQRMAREVEERLTEVVAARGRVDA